VNSIQKTEDKQPTGLISGAVAVKIQQQKKSTSGFKWLLDNPLIHQLME